MIIWIPQITEFSQKLNKKLKDDIRKQIIDSDNKYDY